jgi:hypothetical protein
MPRVQELHREVLSQMGDPPVRHADHQILHRDRVRQGVQRLAFRARLSLPLQVLVVFLLDLRRIREHDGAEVAGSRGRVDRPVKSLAHQERQPAGVVDMRVAQHHAVDPPRVEGHLGVEAAGLPPAPLEETGIQEKSPAGRFEQVHRAGHLPRAAKE